jgi:Tol biopolymer transport system component
MKLTISKISGSILLITLLVACKVPAEGGTEAMPTSTSVPALAPSVTLPPSPTLTPSPEPIPTVQANPSVLDGLGLQLLLDGSQGLFLYDIDNRQLLDLHLQEGARFPLSWEWSPDGSRLLYVEQHVQDGQTSITYSLLNPETGELRELLVEDAPGFLWHPNGRALLINDQFIDPANGAVLAAFDAPTWLAAAISPDGKQVVFADFETNRFARAEILLDTTGQVSGISPLEDLGLELVGPVDDQGERQNPPVVVNMKWNPQEDSIAMIPFTFGELAADITLLDPQTGDIQNLTSSLTVGPVTGIDQGSLAWSPDGTRLAFSAFEGNGPVHRVFIIDVNSLQISEITGGDFPEGINPVWVPGGEALIFAELISNRLVVCQPDGSEKQLLGNEIQAYYSGFRP